MKLDWGCLAIAAAVALLPATSSAQSVEEFYAGRTVTLSAPDAGGSGYDAYARLVARFMADKMPGKPNIIIQNTPGAGGLIQANGLFNTAPKDGSVFAIIMHGIVLRPLLDPREVRYKTEGFRFLGSVTPIVVIGAVNKDAPVQKAAELFDKELLLGGSGGTTVYLAQAINQMLGTKMKMITGYKSTKDITLAMMRKEVHGVVGIGLDSIQTHNEGNAEQFNIIFQMGSVRSKELPDVPLIQEFAKSPDDKAALEAVFATFSVGRVFVTLQIPDDRYNALQKAFEATVKDPAFVEAAKKQRSSVGYVAPGEIKQIIDRIYALPEPIVKRAAAAMAGAN